LLRLRAGKQHAECEHVLEAIVVDPLALIDEDAMHQRNLAGGSAEA